MSQAHCIVAVADKRVRRVVSQLARASSLDVTALINPDHIAERLTDDGHYSLMVLDWPFLDKLDDAKASELIGRATKAKAKTVLLTTEPVKEVLPRMYHDHGITNVMAGTTETLGLELLVTLNKLVYGDIFGLDRYLPVGTRIVSRTIHDSTRRPTVLDELREFVSAVGCPDRLGNNLITAADELITNAVYDAPVDENGKPRYRHTSRQVRIDLASGEEVSVKYACDGIRLGIAVTDNFGALRPETVVSYLERCFQRGADQIEQKKGGAGIGLFMTYDAVHNFVVNIAPGRRTQIIGIIDIAGTYRESLAMDTSFHIFVDNGPGAPRD